MSKRIGLIYTGGTFGMVDSAEGLAPSERVERASDIHAGSAKSTIPEPR
jgi:L-asparaginase/Glu-tRNA(Gln) amidotransferase subunit D